MIAAMKSILVVDDNAVNRALVSTYIRREGYRVIQAVDGMSAVEMAIAEKPDLILMDLDMPGMDGWEATRRIKEESGLSKIPIVALTGFKGQKNITDAVSAGFTGYETKPILFSRLAERVSGFLKAPGTAPGTESATDPNTAKDAAAPESDATKATATEPAATEHAAPISTTTEAAATKPVPDPAAGNNPDSDRAANSQASSNQASSNQSPASQSLSSHVPAGDAAALPSVVQEPARESAAIGA